MVNDYYEPSEVLISLREPYNKKTVWICPNEDNIQVKIFDKGWKIILQTKDTGLSEKALEQVNVFNENLKGETIKILKKYLGKFSSDYFSMLKRVQYLESKIQTLEDKFDKLNKKYSKLINNG